MEPLRREAGVAAESEAEVEAKAEGCLVIQPQAKLDVVMLLRLRDRMKQQLTEHSTAVRAIQENCLDHITEQNFIDSATQNLEQDVEEVKVSFQNKALALQRIQVMVALRNKVKQNDNDSRLILETLKHIVKLSSAVLQYQKQAHEKEQKLNDIKMKRLSLKKAGKQKLLEINEMMKKKKEEQAKRNVSTMMEKINNIFKKERNMTTVIQNVFQNLIIASRVNWAEDPSLKAIVLHLEKNVNFL
ncbi:centromere protein H [Rissa tridactyla]|uniref:centromere protein H n=1 Tax=Rissa tridactyla TaxID=75485 RepID=UPI0023BA45CA|nr:centromere protein H [Rissa tridactyla]